MENALPRIKGHANASHLCGKFNDKWKPACKCGWVGAAGSKSQARVRYADHLSQVAAGKYVPLVLPA
jgi:hypothetical protein